MTNEVFHIAPLEDPKVYFPDIVHSYLEKYLKFMAQIGANQEDILTIELFSQHINMCLQEYYGGQHSSARYLFDQAMRRVRIDECCVPLRETVFYRARSAPGQRLTADEMFHIPFDMRYLVSTRRYSYPGLPCLYLGASPEVCCEELRDWSDDLNIARIERTGSEELSVLDLTFFESICFESADEAELRRFLRLWPLVACCSFTYRETENMTFRPDYTLPQLLLEHIIDKNADAAMGGAEQNVIGIKYRSVLKPFFESSTSGDPICCQNYVFPALSGHPAGYCPALQKWFRVTSVSLLGELRQ